MIHKMPNSHRFHNLDLWRSLIFKGQQPLELSEFQKGSDCNQYQKTYDLIPLMTYYD